MTLEQSAVRPPAQTRGAGPAGQRRRSRREEILEIAVGLFATRGYHGVSMDDIGAAAGVLRGIGALGEALEADLLHAELLMRAGDPAPAEPLLRSVLGTAPEGSQAGQNAAWMLAEALEAMNRSAEAAEIRKRHLEQ